MCLLFKEQLFFWSSMARIHSVEALGLGRSSTRWWIPAILGRLGWTHGVGNNTYIYIIIISRRFIHNITYTYIYIHKKCICSTVKLYDFLINPAILGRLQRNVHAGLVRFSSTLDPCHTVYPCRWRGDFRVVWDVLLPGWATFLWSPTVDVNFICTQNHTKVMFSSFV